MPRSELNELLGITDTHGGKREGAGRPTLYTEEVGEEVLRLMIDENLSLVTISKRDDMPSYSTLWRWQRSYPEFEVRVSEAERARATRVPHEIAELEDEVRMEVISPAQGNTLIKAKHMRAQMMAPRDFNPVQRHELTGANGAPLELSRDESTSAARLAALVLLAVQRSQGKQPVVIDGEFKELLGDERADA